MTSPSPDPIASARNGSGARARPRQARAQLTYERLLDVAGELLAEVGIERISTNMIAARAGMNPAALYRYFDNVYAVLQALGERLMDRQDAVLFSWIEKSAPLGPGNLAAGIEELLRAMAAVTRQEPGAAWTMRALRAVPQLAHVRSESHQRIIERLTEAMAGSFPEIPQEILQRRIRIATLSVIHTVDVTLQNGVVEEDVLFSEIATLFRKVFC